MIQTEEKMKQERPHHPLYRRVAELLTRGEKIKGVFRVQGSCGPIIQSTDASLNCSREAMFTETEDDPLPSEEGTT